jgi:hypothetical protein
MKYRGFEIISKGFGHTYVSLFGKVFYKAVSVKDAMVKIDEVLAPKF